ncbi:TetR/AcrR family transcriptional regulator [Sinimarinibacterium thermocellulolyticum]|uniref:TetR family transcriptional regulator n=1 Tax=Sinimarinibacterium thermocellulolyticum TaxID=3170016 RepID=A0ABV2AA35_9GAMM
MTASAKPTASLRTLLLDAGRRLLDAGGAEDLTEAAVCAAAELPATTLRQAFDDWDDYRCALLNDLFDEVRDRVTRITDNMPPSVERLKLALETYFEANLGRPALRRLVLSLAFTPCGARLIQSRMTAFAVMMGIELRALHRPHPQASARLLTAAAAEIALAEHEAGAREPALRDTLFRYLERAA